MTKLRFILFPFALIYAFITETRNFLYKIGWLKSTRFDVPVISVGNLSMGGTGKTPHIIYIGELLRKNNLNFATLSRGYGRKIKGFLEVELNSTAENVGDEPLLFKQHFTENIIAVCEDRVFGATEILNKNPNTTVLLDDAYQHQKIARSLNILLTDYQHLFYKDFIFPVGNLRELKKNKSRADVIIVTKCPENILEVEQQKITKKIAPRKKQSVYFSSIVYNGLMTLFNNQKLAIESLKNKKIVLATGLANSKSLIDFLKKENTILHHFNFNDHYNYSINDVESIIETFQKLNADWIIITEKDAVKLRRFSRLKALPLYAISIGIKFINQENNFDNHVVNHVRNYS